jgi:hypothetical protein
MFISQKQIDSLLSRTYTSSAITQPQTTPDIWLTPFIRENDVNFSARGLKPAVSANLYFDQIKVNSLAQRAAVINVTSNTALTAVKINQGIFGLTTYAYSEILGASATEDQNLLYVNPNFITLKLSKIGAAADFADSDFNVGDIVYQTTDNLAFKYLNNGNFDYPNYTFYAKVKKWYRVSASLGYLVVEPLEGRANSTLDSAVSNNVFNANNSVNRAVDFLVANTKYTAGETIVYSSNNATLATVSSSNSFVSLSSFVPRSNAANLSRLVISSNNITRDEISDVVGNTVYIVSGTNQGFYSTVTATSSNSHYIELHLANALPVQCTSNSIYSIGTHKTDDVGSMYGIFHIPSENNLKWTTGEKVFTITDTATYNDNNYQFRAIAKYTALGMTDTTENARNPVLIEQTPSSLQAPSSTVSQSTPRLNDRKFMSQTFFTPKKSEIVNGQVRASYGVFVSSIDLFFYQKPTTVGELLPFSVAITKVANGLPTEEVLAERTLDATQIKVSSLPSSSNTATLTKFAFEDPVYLLPETEYAIRLHTESPDYQVWTATVGGTTVDETGNSRRVSQQPYVGNFFKAQNASNWNPVENQDLMFRLNRAVFSSSAETYFEADPAYIKTNVLADLMKLSSTEQQFTPTNVKYFIQTNLIDNTTVSNLELKNNEIYNFAKDIDISSSTNKKRRVVRANKGSDVNVRVLMTTTDDSISPIINKERLGLFALQNIINNSGIANNLISITSRGTSYNIANGLAVTISSPDVGTNRATANVLPGHLSASGEILGVNIINPGSGYFTSPTIAFSETGGNGTGAIARINGETDNAGGNHLAKYQTKIITLDDGFDAGDLIVRMNSIRPTGTNIAVYFKVLSAQDSESFVDKKWQRMQLVQDIYSPTTKDVVSLEYKYSLDAGYLTYVDNGKTYPLGGKFKYFAIKIRLSAADPSVVPMVDSLRVIAVPGG